jgi:Kef-type K+ transport system membrane component KefB
MTPFLQFLLALAIIVIAAKLSGYASTRLGQPAVVGELLAGLILGPTLLDMLHWPFFTDEHLAESIGHLAELGVLFLMFIAGLEVDLDAMLEAGRPATLAGVLGVIVPVGLGLLAALPFGFDAAGALFVGVLRSRVGIALLSAAVVDDILVILFLSLATALVDGGGGGGALVVAGVLGRMLAFLALSFWLGRMLIPRLGELADRMPISEGLLALVIVIIALYGWAAEVLGGVAAITGAFLAGLIFARTHFRDHIEERMHSLAYAWLVPIFFVSIGLEANARELGASGIPFALTLIGVALVSKIVGSGLGARLGGFSTMDALRIGVGMSSRGEVGLIVATVGLGAGLITQSAFASVVIMVLVTTLVTPILLRALYSETSVQL